MCTSYFKSEEKNNFLYIFLIDRCVLEEPEKVDKIQWHLVNCLRCVAKKNFKNPDERLWKIFDKFILLRDFAEYGREVNSLKCKWEAMKNHPLVLEMINPEPSL